MKKKILLGLGAATSVVAPIAAIVSCSFGEVNKVSYDFKDKRNFVPGTTSKPNLDLAQVELDIFGLMKKDATNELTMKANGLPDLLVKMKSGSLTAIDFYMKEIEKKIKSDSK